MSDQNSTPNNNNNKPSIRLRSRFPKAQPNIGLSSGINRIRRLSGHYNENEKPEEISEKSDLSQRTRRNSIRLQQNNDLNESTTTISHQTPPPAVEIQTPAVVETTATTKETIETTSIANVQQEIPMILNDNEFTSTNQQLLNELQDNNYNPRFSKEHIMNIIKHKAMQKLKKIESDSLKEKRRTYKPTVDTENVDRSKLRMRDLLYYNSKNRAKKTSSADNTLSLIDENSNLTARSIDTTSDRLSISSMTSPPPPPVIKEKEPEATLAVNYNAPQLKFAEDGSIVLNEESLVVQRPHVEPVYDSTVIENDRNDNLTYNSYRKFHHTKKWSSKETVKFYKALSMIGTDFTMIQKLFPLRNRDEIKRKFKREEKLNQALIDKILSKTTPMDFSVFVPTDTEDEGNANSNNNNNDENSNDTNTTINSNENENNKKNNKKPYNRYKPKRTKKRAFIESDEDNPIATNDENNNNNNNAKEPPLTTNEMTTTTAAAATTEVIKNNTEEIMSKNIINSIDTVINRVNETSGSSISRSNSHEIIKNNPIETNIPQKEEIEEEKTNEDDDDDDDIEMVIDLDNDYCEIIDNNNKNTTTSMEEEQSINTASASTQNDEEIVILDLDSNQTIIKNSKKEILLQNNRQRPASTTAATVLQPTTPIKSASSMIASSASTLLSSPQPFSNSKLIFVHNPGKDSDDNSKQFQVHMFTPQQQQQQQQSRASNSEIVITKISQTKSTKK